MNLRHIEIFHAVYVNGSVSAAARALNVSQPSVSKMLRHAESPALLPELSETVVLNKPFTMDQLRCALSAGCRTAATP